MWFKSQADEGSRQVREVWAWNFEEEFAALMMAVNNPSIGGSGAFVALDTEFPGFVSQTDISQAPAECYQALRENVDQLWPIQIGVAVASCDSGSVHGVWSFNLLFDAAVDLHSKSSVAFLRAAGIDFARHRAEGIHASDMGRRLAASMLVGPHENAPCWLTFSGMYDLGYLLKILTSGRPLPSEPDGFDNVVSMYCPRRCDLRSYLPSGSLESLGKKHGVKRHGSAHTAGSDALLTLELFLNYLKSQPMALPKALDKNSWNSEMWNSWSHDRAWQHQQYWEEGWGPDRWSASFGGGIPHGPWSHQYQNHPNNIMPTAPMYGMLWR